MFHPMTGSQASAGVAACADSSPTAGRTAALSSGHLTFLITEFGKPFAVAGFGNWFRQQCDFANLRHCSFHGLRKAASVRLAEAGCTPHEIAAITGHASLEEIVRYRQTADRKRLGASAMEKVRTRT